MRETTGLVSAAITEVTGATYPALYKGPLTEGVKQAALHGYDAVELHIPQASVIDGSAFFDHCEAHRMRVSAISTGLAHSTRNLSLISDEKSNREDAITCMVEHISLAKSLESGVIIGLIRGNYPSSLGKDKAVARLREAINRILDEAERYGVPVYFEAITKFLCNYFCNIKETVDFVASFNNPLFLLHIDTYHMNFEEHDFLGSILACEGHLGYVHYSENNRRIPGMGIIDFMNTTKMLSRIGYTGYIALECVPDPSSDITGPLGASYVRNMIQLAETMDLR